MWLNFKIIELTEKAISVWNQFAGRYEEFLELQRDFSITYQTKVI